MGRVIFIGFACLVAIVAGLAGATALRNRRLPSRSVVTDRLAPLEKARIAEAIHLRQSVGDVVWPGWGGLDIPLILYNEAFAFLIGYPDPPPGWVKMPARLERGTAWEAVSGDTFFGEPYYRQSLTEPGVTPEFFAVLVGERWVASAQTLEYMEISFYSGFRASLPPFLRAVFPARLVWRLLVGDTDTYIGAIEHEAFHALQAMLAPEHLASAEAAASRESRYPWEDRSFREAWESEADTLLQAARAASAADVARLTAQFLDQRDARRAAHVLSAELVDFERQREWLEGLAKYAELSIGRAAMGAQSYRAVDAVQEDTGFRKYAGRERAWRAQLGELRRRVRQAGESRFYYTGMAQAALLDRLDPGWKGKAMRADVALEDLLREVVP